MVVEDRSDGTTPFDLPLELVLGKMPQKTFTFTTPTVSLKPLMLPNGLTVRGALDRYHTIYNN